ncbi:hypothetical protein [Sphingobium yanoikuyae]|uniref:hypothetical protein n=1 Tax=Sphingobium yanoikuyae TaxID=13690 RepID=UPI003AF66FEF
MTEGQCFTYVIPPVFAEGKYEVGNFAAVPMKEHFGLSSDLHRQMASLPEGATPSVANGAMRSAFFVALAASGMSTNHPPRPFGGRRIYPCGLGPIDGLSVAALYRLR